MLEARELMVWRGDNLLLDAVSFTLNENTIMQIRGTNGSGKTTLLRIVCGLALADEGEVYWHGKALHKQRDEFNAQLLHIGHRPGIKGALTAIENLQFFCSMAGLSEAPDLQQSIDEALTALSLQDKSDIPTRFLSAGQQRRVALARLILQPAKLWVLDEPLTSLDLSGHDWVAARISAHVNNGGSVLLTTHTPLVIAEHPVETYELG